MQESGRDIFHLYGDRHVASNVTHIAWTLVAPVLGPASTYTFEDASWLHWHGIRLWSSWAASNPAAPVRGTPAPAALGGSWEERSGA